MLKITGTWKNNMFGFSVVGRTGAKPHALGWQVLQSLRGSARARSGATTGRGAAGPSPHLAAAEQVSCRGQRGTAWGSWSLGCALRWPSHFRKIWDFFSLKTEEIHTTGKLLAIFFGVRNSLK